MRIILAGTGSAVGKTTISTGIMKALSEKYNVQPFKVGPDYIDPSYHTLATGNVSRNLDSFFMSEGQVRDSFIKGMNGKDMGIIEGVRGLFEGIDSVNDIGSTASIAKALNAPVILIVNSKSLVKSAAAIVLGFKSLDPEINIAGVILNKVKHEAHYQKTKRSIEEITGVEVIGGIKRDDTISIEQRHLGLVPAVERENSLKFIDMWSKTIKESIDLDRLVEIMKESPKITANREPIWNKLNKQKVNIAVAYDEVFNFYYKENIESLEDNHAKIHYFSPLKDEHLPDVDALYIGGGYPELFALVNMALFSINMLPVGMLDGGKILRAVLMKKLRYETACRICDTISLIFTILLWLAAVYLLLVTGSNISLYLAAVWLFRKLFLSKERS